jgi:hypothetical protein
MSKRDFMWEVVSLEQYALDNYEVGGHWVYETFSDLDYAEVVFESTSLEDGKKIIKECWERLLEQERECSWGE